MSGAVVVLGASGQIGRFALPRLIAAGRRVLAIGRRGAPRGYPALEGVRWAEPAFLESGELASAPALLSAGPIDLALRAAPRLPGLERVVCFSTSSLWTKRDSPDRGERAQVAAIAAAEAELETWCDANAVALALFRPTLIYGCGLDRNVTRIARWIRRWGVVPLAGRAAGLRQPVHGDDLAATAVAALVDARPVRLACALAGGETLAYREMVGRIFEALGRAPRTWSVPAPLLTAAAAVAGRLPGFGGLNAEMVRRQATDLVFDDAPARARLGHAPRGFHPAAPDFEPPSADRILALARGG